MVAKKISQNKYMQCFILTFKIGSTYVCVVTDTEYGAFQNPITVSGTSVSSTKEKAKSAIRETIPYLNPAAISHERLRPRLTRTEWNEAQECTLYWFNVGSEVYGAYKPLGEDWYNLVDEGLIEINPIDPRYAIIHHLIEVIRVSDGEHRILSGPPALLL